MQLQLKEKFYQKKKVNLKIERFRCQCQR